MNATETVNIICYLVALKTTMYLHTFNIGTIKTTQCTSRVFKSSAQQIKSTRNNDNTNCISYFVCISHEHFKNIDFMTI